jgi:hypothetical protein
MSELTMAEMEEKVASKLRLLVEKKRKRDELKTALKAAEEDFRNYESEVHDELTEGPQRGSRRYDLGGDIGEVVFTPQEKFFGRVIDKDAAVAHFRAKSMEAETTEVKLSGARINEIVNECIDEGKPLPPGIDFYPKRYITVSMQD